MNQPDATAETPAENRTHSDDAGSVLTNTPAIVGAIASQVVLITGFLYYFGWMYENSFLGYFGVDSSLVDFGTIYYLLHSIDPAFEPFVYLAFVAFVLSGFHRLLVAPALIGAAPDSRSLSNNVESGMSARPFRWRHGRSIIDSMAIPAICRARSLRRWRLEPNGLRWIISAMRTMATILSVIIVISLLFPGWVGVRLGPFLPLFLLLVVGLLGYIEYVRSKCPTEVVAARSDGRTSGVYIAGLLIVAIIAAVWTVSRYAERVGTQFATHIATELPIQPRIVVYSAQWIALNGPGVVVQEIKQPDTRYHYQYTGLRLLVRSGDKFVLLPSQWRRGRDRVFFLHDDNSIRIDTGTW